MVTRALLDTSVFVAGEQGRPLVGQLPPELAVSIITIAELEAGVLAAHDLDSRTRRLATFVDACALDPIPVDGRVARAWSRLRVQLRDTRQQLAVDDSWIAATAIAHELPLVTQDRDFATIAGLTVIHA